MDPLERSWRTRCASTLRYTGPRYIRKSSACVVYHLPFFARVSKSQNNLTERWLSASKDRFLREEIIRNDSHPSIATKILRAGPSQNAPMEMCYVCRSSLCTHSAVVSRKQKQLQAQFFLLYYTGDASANSRLQLQLKFTTATSTCNHASVLLSLVVIT